MLSATGNCHHKMADVSVSCVKSRYDLEIKANFNGLESQYVQNKLEAKHKINVLNYFWGQVVVGDSETNGKCIVFFICGIEEMTGKILKISTDPECDLENGQTQMNQKLYERKIRNTTDRRLYLTKKLVGKGDAIQKLKSVSATIQVCFEAKIEHIRKQTLINGFSAIHNFCINQSEDKMFGNYAPVGSEKVEIICGDNTIEFNKNVLCSVSDVFRTMFENPDNVEHQSRSVKIEDVDPQTILSFQSLLRKIQVADEHLNVATLLFADRYNVQPIVKLCIDHLKSNITKDNFPEIVKASDLINDKGLLCAAVDFASKNIGTFENDPDVKKFIRTNQDSFIKVFEEMMFKK